MGLADTFKSIWVCKGAIEGAFGKYFRLADTLKSVSVILRCYRRCFWQVGYTKLRKVLLWSGKY